ncbi:MAG: tetraacyldisaccharide 4'-kinase [Desulfuromonadales bacterium]
MSGWRSEYLRMTANGPQSVLSFIIFWGLSPLSFLYSLAMRMRGGLYRAGLKKSYRAAVPVVSVGNLATGGTGKTPMIDFLTKYLSGRAVKCAIVSRGYGGSYRQAVGRVADAHGHLLMTPQECGDEPCLLAMRNPHVPVYVARQRMLGVQAAEQDGARLILLDDGFQHLAVQRDLDIVLLDAQYPVGNGRVLPAGLLREPVSALQRADLIVMTRSDAEIKNTLRVSAPVMHGRHQLNKRLTTLKGKDVAERDYAGKRCLAFAGIARPGEFFRSLRDFDFSCAEQVALADHQEYTPEILNRLLGSCHNYDFMVTTEKDAVKLASVNFPVPCYQVGVDLAFDDISPLAGMLERIIEQCA